MEIKFLWLRGHPRRNRLKKIEYTIANQKVAESSIAKLKKKTFKGNNMSYYETSLIFNFLNLSSQ